MSYTSTEVKARYNAKTYKRYSLTLRYDEDQELIDAIEELISSGMSASEALRSMIKAQG